MKDVFIVEDEEMIQQLYKDVLSMRGYNVMGVASTGEQGVEMFRSFETKPDLIIMDHRMPGMGGLDAARLIQEEEDTGTKIILVSADDNAVWEALKMGIVGMKKPFNIGDLLSAIEAASPGSKVVDGDGKMKKPPKPTVTDPGLYLVREADGEKGIQVYQELLANGYKGISFTRKHPDVLRKREELTDVPVIWFTSTPVKDFTCISPMNIQKMLIMIQSAIGESGSSVVFVWGFEYILTNIDFDRALNLIQVINDRVMTSSDTLVIFSMDLDILDEKEKKLIEREFEIIQ